MKSPKISFREEIKAALKDIGVATKEDLKSLATKEDLKSLATKEDLKSLAEDLLKTERSLKRRMGVERNKIIVMIGKLATSTPTSKAFNELKDKVERRGSN